jgi:hypothetical protein
MTSRLIGGALELLSLGVFMSMIWLWAALSMSPGV